MYFTDRKTAGQLLASRMMHLRKEEQNYPESVVLALSDGGLVVGKEIAQSLNAPMVLLLTDTITLPGQSAEVIGTLDQSGRLYPNKSLPPQVLEEYMGEFHNHIDEQKMQKMRELNIISDAGLAHPEQFKGKNVIVVSDGEKLGIVFEVAYQFLETLSVAKIIGAVPVASVAAIDKLHIYCDEIHCLFVTDNYLDTNHYYDDPYLPGHEEVMATIVGK